MHRPKTMKPARLRLRGRACREEAGPGVPSLHSRNRPGRRQRAADSAAQQQRRPSRSLPRGPRRGEVVTDGEADHEAGQDQARRRADCSPNQGLAADAADRIPALPTTGADEDAARRKRADGGDPEGVGDAEGGATACRGMPSIRGAGRLAMDDKAARASRLQP